MILDRSLERLGIFLFCETIIKIEDYEAGASNMDRGKLIAIFTGAISILIAIAYLVIVQLLDFRGEMIPAPVSQITVGFLGAYLH